jgi:hypothetical protein
MATGWKIGAQEFDSRQGMGILLFSTAYPASYPLDT